MPGQRCRAELPWRCCSSAAIRTHFPVSQWVFRVGVPHVSPPQSHLGVWQCQPGASLT